MGQRSENPLNPRVLTFFTGGFVLILVLPVLLGWIFNLPQLLVVRGGLTPMQFNTALLFIFSSLQLLFLQVERQKAVCVLASFVFVFSLVTFAQYIGDFNAGIDQVFLTSHILTGVSHAGRMAPSTALCFASFALSCGLLSYRKKIEYFVLLLASLSSLLPLVFGAISAAGYIFHIEAAYSWGNYSKIAPNTAIAFVLLSIGILPVLLGRLRLHGSGRVVFAPLGVLVGLLVCTTVGWQTALLRDRAATTEKIAFESKTLLRLIQNAIDDRANALLRMGLRWEAGNGTPEKVWRADARNYCDQMKGFVGIGYADASTQLKWSEPAATQSVALGFRLNSEAKREETLERAKISHRPEITKHLQLRMGGLGFSYILAVYVHKKLDGFISAGIRYADFFELLKRQNLVLDRNDLVVEEEGEQLYSSRRESTNLTVPWALKQALNLGRVTWDITLIPKPETVRDFSSDGPISVLFVGLFISLLTSMLIHAYLRAEAVGSGALTRAEELLLKDKERAQIIQQLTESEQRLDLALAAAEMGAWDIDLKSKTSIRSLKHDQIFGYETALPSDQWGVEAFVDHIVPEDRALAHQSFKEAASSGVINFIARILRKDKTLRWIQVNGRSYKSADGQISRMMGTVVDITEKKVVDDQLLKAREEALHAAAAKAEFLATMSHEIRTPLNGVIGMAELMMDTPLSNEQKKYARIIQDSGANLLMIINDILDFSKIEAGKLKLEILNFDLGSTIENQVDLLSLKARHKGISLSTFVDPKLPSLLRGDAGRIAQVFLNLLGNAIKFTAQGTVKTAVVLKKIIDKRAQIEISVEDSGIGINPRALSQLFKPFSQADTSTSRKFGGTGLGLSISKQLVELMGGSIGVESQLGVGSKFHFNLTLEIANPRTLKDLAKEAGDRGLNRLRILFVDDDLATREIFSTYFSAWGMKSSCVDSGKAALSLLREAYERSEPYDIVITDKRMPQMDGFALAETIKKEFEFHRLPKLVLVTGFDHSLQREGAFDAGFLAYLTKPVKQSELYDALVKVAEGEKRANPSLLQPLGDREKLAPAHLGRILVVEDNSANQILALTQLKKLGYSASAVANGLEAIESFKTNSYQLILMDCQMPEMDGFEATRQIRQLEFGTQKHIPIIALTANAIEGDEHKCLEAGMDDYIAKPFKREGLSVILKKWMTRIESLKKTS